MALWKEALRLVGSEAGAGLHIYRVNPRDIEYIRTHARTRTHTHTLMHMDGRARPVDGFRVKG